MYFYLIIFFKIKKLEYLIFLGLGGYNFRIKNIKGSVANPKRAYIFAKLIICSLITIIY